MGTTVSAVNSTSTSAPSVTTTPTNTAPSEAIGTIAFNTSNSSVGWIA